MTELERKSFLEMQRLILDLQNRIFLLEMKVDEKMGYDKNEKCRMSRMGKI